MVTRSANRLVTDSAASATAYAAGIKVNNYQVGALQGEQRRPTVIDLARQQGKGTGIVVACSLTHATPAAFYAYAPSRKQNELIAQQLYDAGIDVLIGGGAKYLRPYLDKFRTAGWQVVTSHEETDKLLESNASQLPRKLLLITAEKHPGPASKRYPKLHQLTGLALSILSRNPKGFFLLVEGSQIDWAGHENDLSWELQEMDSFNRTLELLLAYYDRHPNTLIVVTADHETGGLSLIDKNAAKLTQNFQVNYSSGYHTAEFVPVFFKLPAGSRSLLVNKASIIDNTDVHKILKAAIMR